MQIEAFGAVLKQHGFRRGAGVPCSYFTPLVNYMTVDPELDYLSATSEGEAVAIAAGMVTAGSPAFALMQNSGLGNAVNPITSLLYIYRMPVVLLVSHRGQPGVPDEPQHELHGNRRVDRVAARAQDRVAGVGRERIRRGDHEAPALDGLLVDPARRQLGRRGQLRGQRRRRGECNAKRQRRGERRGARHQGVCRQWSTGRLACRQETKVSAMPATIN